MFADAFISAEKGYGIENLKKLIFKSLNLISIYLKEPGKPTDMEEPLIMRKDSTISLLCKKLHRDFMSRFRFARVWGKSAKHEGQQVHLNHVLADDDVVELHMS